MNKVFFCNKQGEKLTGILHKPNKLPAPAVIISHGFGSSKDNKKRWASRLCDDGFLVLRFDFSGHGESAGDIAETTLTKVAGDLKSAIDLVKSMGAKNIGLTGHSMGGVVSMIAARHATAIVAIAPPSDFHSMYEHRRKTGLIDLEEWRRKGSAKLFGITINYSFYSDAMKYDQKKIADGIKCPVLLIHGDADEIVPLEQSERLFRELKCEKKLEILKRTGHDLKGEEYARMIKLTKQWFMQRLF